MARWETYDHGVDLLGWGTAVVAELQRRLVVEMRRCGAVLQPRSGQGSCNCDLGHDDHLGHDADNLVRDNGEACGCDSAAVLRGRASMPALTGSLLSMCAGGEDKVR